MLTKLLTKSLYESTSSLMRSKRGQTHHSRIVITRLPPEIGDQVRNRRRRLPVEPVEIHDRLLPHGFLLELSKSTT
ncbi:hypothetical protein Bca101_019014 [Brassica carinata]